jgi:hypothetical protein
MNKYAIGTILGAAAISGIKKVGSRSKMLHRKNYAELVFSLITFRLTNEIIEEARKRLIALDFVSEARFINDRLYIVSIHLDPKNPIELHIPTYCEQIAQVLNKTGVESIGDAFLFGEYLDLEDWLENNEEFNFMLSKKITGDPFKDNNYRIHYGAEFHGELLNGVYFNTNGHEISIRGLETSEFWFYDEQGNKFMTSRDATPKLRRR